MDKDDGTMMSVPPTTAPADLPMSEWPAVPTEEIVAFVRGCMATLGVKAADGEKLGELLVAADSRGHYSHGLNRLDMYMEDVRCGHCEKGGEPEIIKEKAATAWVDGKNLLGAVVGPFCMDLAIAKAKEAGIGWVVAKGSNHFGIAGYHSMAAEKQGMVGMAFTNTSPFLVPTRSRQPFLGTNPISVAAGAQEGDSFVLDMATTTVAQGKIEVAHRRGGKIPEGWGVDSDGKPCNDPAVVLESGTMSPLGGSEECGGYKGYGLAMMVELFCGILGGSEYASLIRKWGDGDKPANLGQCFVALDPECFAPGFADRLSSMMDMARNLPTADGSDAVMVPGDPERVHMKLCEERGGIPYHPNQIAHANILAASTGVKPMKPVSP